MLATISAKLFQPSVYHVYCCSFYTQQVSSPVDRRTVEVSSNYLVFLGGSSSTAKKTLGSRRNSVRISFYRFFSQSGADEFHFQHPGYDSIRICIEIFSILLRYTLSYVTLRSESRLTRLAIFLLFRLRNT